MKKVTLDDVKVIDAHCHPYHPTNYEMEPEEFIRKLSLSVLPEMFTKQRLEKFKPYPRTNMFVQIMIMKLAELYSCEPTLESVLIERNNRILNYPQYVKSLFDDSNLVGLLLDFSYPTPKVEKKQFIELVQTQTFEIYRIEPVMENLSREFNSFENFIDAYRIDLKKSLELNHVLGLKSIIAYRSGLEIKEMDWTGAEEEYQLFISNSRSVVKLFRDFCLHIAIEECTASGKAMHIHTGFGDGEVVLSKASPKFLLDLLRDSKYKNTVVHLVHGGYPWMEEAAFIVSILPNVYMDISLQVPFTGHGSERIISQVFELAPFDKVMYGSDAINLPEINWLGVRLFKEAFERVLNQWVEDLYMSAETARSIGEMVLYQNFQNTYGKP